MTTKRTVFASTLIFVAGFSLGTVFQSRGAASAQAGTRVFELRTYTAPDGKLPELHKRFRDHTRRIFDKHGMKSIGYWTPLEGPNAETTLIYILEHPSREEARKNWAAFQADPEWIKAKTESEAGGPILAKPPESVFLNPTDFSPLK